MRSGVGASAGRKRRSAARLEGPVGGEAVQADMQAEVADSGLPVTVDIDKLVTLLGAPNTGRVALR